VIKDRNGKVYGIEEAIRPDKEFYVDLKKVYGKEITNTNDQLEAIHLAKEEYIKQALLHLN